MGIPTPTGPCARCEDEGEDPPRPATTYYPEYRPSLSSRRVDDHVEVCALCWERLQHDAIESHAEADLAVPFAANH
jgi:hypothetical protein